MLFTQLVLVLLSCSTAASDDSSPPIRKRTKQVHSSSYSTAVRLRGGSTARDTDNFDPYIGVERELQVDDLAMSTPTEQSMSLSMSMNVSPPPTPAPVIVDLGYEPCDDPDHIPSFPYIFNSVTHVANLALGQFRRHHLTIICCLLLLHSTQQSVA